MNNKREKIKEEIRKKVRGIIIEKLLNEFASDSMGEQMQQQGLSDFTARRSIQLRAREAAFDFEKEIIKGLGLKNPDQMDGNSQNLYGAAVKKLELNIMKAVLEVIPDLASLPKEETEEKNKAGNTTKTSPSPIPEI